jgi:hypothetical protein
MMIWEDSGGVFCKALGRKMRSEQRWSCRFLLRGVYFYFIHYLPVALDWFKDYNAALG